jgi:hypothetical protein
MSPLLTTLQALEVELHHPGVRCDRPRLEALLHADFHEVGRSGRRYTRQTVVDHLLATATHPTVVSEHFAVALLSADVALLTYRSAHEDAQGTRTLHTHQASVWQATAAGWQLRYHQGTPAAEPW